MKHASVTTKVGNGSSFGNTLFNFEGPKNLQKRWKRIESGRQHVKTWGCSSVGRAPALQAGGRQFESVHLHHGRPEGRAEKAADMGS